MLSWFLETYSSPSSRAQLVAIVISAVIAILVLLLNQFFTTRRTRKDILIKKIEDLYQSALAYERHAGKLLSAIYHGGRDARGNFNLDRALLDGMNEEVEKIEMLLGLYFPSTDFAKDRYYAGPTLPVLEIAIKGKLVSEEESLEAAEATKDNIANNTAELKAICKNLMELHKH